MENKLTKVTIERKYLVTWQEAENLLSNEDFQRRLENGIIDCSLKRNKNNDGKLYELTFTGVLYSDEDKNTNYMPESITTDLKIICALSKKIINDLNIICAFAEEIVNGA